MTHSSTELAFYNYVWWHETVWTSNHTVSILNIRQNQTHRWMKRQHRNDNKTSFQLTRMKSTLTTANRWHEGVIWLFVHYYCGVLDFCFILNQEDKPQNSSIWGNEVSDFVLECSISNLICFKCHQFSCASQLSWETWSTFTGFRGSPAVEQPCHSGTPWLRDSSQAFPILSMIGFLIWNT